MNCDPCIYSLEQGEVSLPTLSLDIPQLQPSSGTPMLAPSSDPVLPMDGSQACACTKEMLGCSTHPNTPVEWIASMRASLVRILAQQEKAPGSQEKEADCIPRSCEQLTLFGPSGSCSKTPQPSEQGAGMSLSPTLWRVDIPGATESLARLMSVRPTSGIGGGALQGVPTPSATEAGEINPDLILGEIKKNQRIYSKKSGKHMQITLNRYVKLWPTPTKSDGSGGPGRDGGENLRTAAGGQLNPMWVAWLMGWPLEHTKLNALEMDKYRSARRRRGRSLVVRK